jgi:uncharacterized protein YfaT (DUF1175 family)
MTFLLIFVLTLFLSPPVQGASLPVMLAEAILKQADSPDPAWDPGQRDCAGLVRYSFSRALNTKKPLWLDRNGNWVNFIRAEELIAYNFKKVSELETWGSQKNDGDYSNLQTGDILVYYDHEKPPVDAWHLMIVVFSQSHPRRMPLVVYHNGARDETAAVRKIWWDTLFSSDWIAWYPGPSNKNFMGIYRLKQLIPPSQKAQSATTNGELK